MLMCQMSRKLLEPPYSTEIYQQLQAGLQCSTGFTQLPTTTSTQFRLSHGRETPANNDNTSSMPWRWFKYKLIIKFQLCFFLVMCLKAL